MLKKYTKLSLVRYIFAGGISFVFELSLSLFIYKVLGIHPALAVSIAFWAGLILAFLLQKLFTFSDYSRTPLKLTGQTLSYGLLVLFNYSFTVFVVSLADEKYFVQSRIFALACVTLWNYLIYKYIIFSKDKVKKVSIPVRNILYFMVLSLPIFLYLWQYSLTGNKMLGGDFDYYAQMYEAFRISVVKFHQFPFWNPWISGGMPLFANPQFGAFSLQGLLTLVVGSIYGLKLSYTLYAIIGFWGMYFVGRNILHADKIRSILVGYIWVFGGFFVWHGMSHFTFALFFLLPWQFFFLHRRREKRSWIYFGLLQALIINSSVHYAFLMTGLALAIFFFISTIDVFYERGWRKIAVRSTIYKPDLLFITKSLILILALSLYRLVLTVDFVKANERILETSADKAITIKTLFQAIFLPIGTHFPVPNELQYGWVEYSMYIGIGSGLALLFILGFIVLRLFKRKKVSFSVNQDSQQFLIGCLVVGFVGFLIALGEFSRFAPFNILQHIPGFTQTRVPSRWLIMPTFTILVVLMSWKYQKKLINVLLLLAVVELFIIYGPITDTGSDSIRLPNKQFQPVIQQFDSGRRHHDYMDVPERSYTLNTMQNYGSIYADDPLLNTLNAIVGTSRCGLNVLSNCDFVLSDNAEVEFWSPNSIRLKRTGEGPIVLNMNTERYWAISDSYIFVGGKRIDPVKSFTIPNDNMKSYEINYIPKYSSQWILEKIGF